VLFTGSLAGRDSAGTDLDFHGLTELQAVKLMLGCYGNFNASTDIWKLLDDLTKTRMMNNLQLEHAPAYTDSMCS
jgi:hypothetical protein